MVSQRSSLVPDRALRNRPQTQQEFCFCTLASGNNYRALASLLAEDIERYSPGTPFVVLTDKPHDFDQYSHVLAFKYHPQSIYPYHDKRLAIAQAISLFDTCMFVDSDVRIISEFPREVKWLPGITARSCAGILKHNEGASRVRQMTLIGKMARKLDLDLEKVKFVHEFLFVVSRASGAEIEFLEQWQKIAPYFELNGYHLGEGSTIGLAAAKAGLPVRHDVMEAVSFFKDKIELVRIKQGQAQPEDKLIYFEQRKRFEGSQRSALAKLIAKSHQRVGRLHRSMRLRLATLSAIDFYYR